MAGKGSVKSGRNFRYYLNGLPVGTAGGKVLARVKMMKPDTQRGLDKILEVGNPNVVEYVKKVPETSLTIDYSVIDYTQFAVAAGQSIGTDGVNTSALSSGEIPDFPDNFDIIERMIVPGTEATANEQVQGYVIYQGISLEKDMFDVEVDKLASFNLTAKCKRPRRFTNVNGINTDRLTGTGVQTAFVLSQVVKRANADGFYMIRVEAPFTFVNAEGTDFTVASTSSSTTLNFVIAPPTSVNPNILAVYAY